MVQTTPDASLSPFLSSMVVVAVTKLIKFSKILIKKEKKNLMWGTVVVVLVVASDVSVVLVVMVTMDEKMRSGGAEPIGDGREWLEMVENR